MAETPLHYSAVLNQPEVARRILEHGGDPTITDIHGNAPLWYAVFNARGSYEVVDLLLARNANPNLKHKHGRSPLDFARQIGDETLIGKFESKI